MNFENTKSNFLALYNENKGLFLHSEKALVHDCFKYLEALKTCVYDKKTAREYGLSTDVFKFEIKDLFCDLVGFITEEISFRRQIPFPLRRIKKLEFCKEFESFCVGNKYYSDNGERDTKIESVRRDI